MKNSNSFYFCPQAGCQQTHMSDSLRECGSICGEWLSRSGGSQRDELGANWLFKTASSHPPLKAPFSSHRDVPAKWKVGVPGKAGFPLDVPGTCNLLIVLHMYEFVTVQS